MNGRGADGDLPARLERLTDESRFPLLEPDDVSIVSTFVSDIEDVLESDLHLPVALSLAWCYHQSKRGHSAILLDQFPTSQLQEPGIEELTRTLQKCFEKIRLKNPSFPFEWRNPGKIALKRFVKYEQAILDFLEFKKSRASEIFESADKVQLGHKGEYLTDEQRKVVEIAPKCEFMLLSGGPGTGKTFTLARCIAAIQKSYPDAEFRYVAPTGKATARLEEALTELGVQTSENPPVTIHRLLVDLRNIGRGLLVQVPQEKIDWLIIDEGSMVDLQMMGKLLATIPRETKVIISGDHFQLASVQPGAVFKDLFLAPTVWKNSPIQSHQLTKTFRFSEKSQIYRVCESIRNRRFDLFEECLELKSSSIDFDWIDPNAPEFFEYFNHLVEKQIPEQFEWLTHEEALQALSNLMIISPFHSGHLGVDKVDTLILKTIQQKAMLASGGYWQPISIQRNDPSTGLLNGEVGVRRVFGHNPRRNADVFFLKDGGIRRFPENLLPENRSSYVTTVHKSQGSEADTVVLLIPESGTQNLSSELLYTAFSRAKKKLVVIATKKGLLKGVKNETRRETGLLDRLSELS